MPGYSVGAEPLDAAQLLVDTGAAPSVAVIGGGIAGCGAAWALQRSGFEVKRERRARGCTRKIYYVCRCPGQQILRLAHPPRILVLLI